MAEALVARSRPRKSIDLSDPEVVGRAQSTIQRLQKEGDSGKKMVQGWSKGTVAVVSGVGGFILGVGLTVGALRVLGWLLEKPKA